MSNRPERVAEYLKEEVSRIVCEELRDPRIGFVTILRVDITKDLRFAKIYYSILGSDKEKKETAEALRSGLGFIRRLISQSIKLRYLPEIRFVLDESAQYGIEIQKILDKINKEPKSEE